jgi:cleavage and polyadenylation specificity factor subunit 1
MIAHGRGATGAITALNREVHPAHLAQIDQPAARGVWAVHARQPPPGGITADFGEDVEANMSADADYDQYLVVSKSEDDDKESTAVYKVSGKDLELTDEGDLERDEGTFNIGVLAKGTKIVQIKQTEFRTFDAGK